MLQETIFSKIIHKEIDADIVYQDDEVTAFKDIFPKAPFHFLIVPNKVIPTINDITIDDEKVLGKLFTVAAKIAKEHGFAQDGYRVIMNCNENGGQEVYHIHLHLLGGKKLGALVGL